MMKKILFLHGFFATDNCPMASALKEAFKGRSIVLTPDLPLHPTEALKHIRTFIDKEHPDLLIGNSCGAFLAQMLSPIVSIPALLGNPHFKMTNFLKDRIGIAHFEPVFLKHYNNSYHFPGGHTPTEQETRTWYAPLAQKILMEYPVKEERFFRHFKDGIYKYIHSAFDSETQEHMVICQALYGEMAYWVRPEKIFFGKVIRDGRTFNRFTEIDR